MAEKNIFIYTASEVLTRSRHTWRALGCEGFWLGLLSFIFFESPAKQELKPVQVVFRTPFHSKVSELGGEEDGLPKSFGVGRLPPVNSCTRVPPLGNALLLSVCTANGKHWPLSLKRMRYCVVNWLGFL